MIDDHRHRIMLAAARVYSQHGSKGATTRRIAEEAGVNEVTIFRQFGSKDALLELVVREGAQLKAQATLPKVPVDPEVELVEWAWVHYNGLCAMRSIVRQIFSEAAERPDVVQCAKHGPSSALAHLREYIVRLRRHGWLAEGREIRPSDVAAAVAMFMGALFNDALNRDMMPEMFPKSPADTVRGYVRVFLRGIGVRATPTHS